MSLARPDRVLPELVLLVVMWVASSHAFAQERQERDGVTIYWGLVPAAIVENRHAIEDLHGGPRTDRGNMHHLVVAVFDSATARRLEDAIVRAQLREPGFMDEAPKDLPQMPVNGQVTYGQWFGTVARSGPYRFRVFVKVPAKPREIQFDIAAGTPHGVAR